MAHPLPWSSLLQAKLLLVPAQAHGFPSGGEVGKEPRVLDENDLQHVESVLARGLEGRRKDSP